MDKGNEISGLSELFMTTTASTFTFFEIKYYAILGPAWMRNN